MSKYDWLNVPKEVKWIATDGLGGRAFGYENKPELAGCVWHKANNMDTVFNLNVCSYSGEFKDSLEGRPK